MDTTDDVSSEGRVTRARRKRLVSIDSEASSRPGTPVSPTRTLRGNIKTETDALPKRITRRNSMTNTPQKTPSKIQEIEFVDVDTPSKRTRRRTVSIQDDNTPQKIGKQQSQLTVLVEEDIKDKQVDKKNVKHGTEKTTKKAKPTSSAENNTKPLKRTLGRRKNELHMDNELDSDIEIINLDDTTNEIEELAKKSEDIMLETEEIKNEPVTLDDTVADNTSPLEKNPKIVISQSPPTTRPIEIDGTPKVNFANTEEKHTPDSSTVAYDEQSKSINSKSVTFENGENLEEESKHSFPKTPAVLKKDSTFMASKIFANRRTLKLTDSVIESEDDDDHYEETESDLRTESEMDKEKITPKKDKIDSRCSTPNVLQRNTPTLPSTPTPEKLLRSGKSYGDSPTNEEHNVSKEMELEAEHGIEKLTPSKETFSPSKIPKSKVLEKSAEHDKEKEEGVTIKTPKRDTAAEIQRATNYASPTKSPNLNSVQESIENNSKHNLNEGEEMETVEDSGVAQQDKQLESNNSTFPSSSMELQKPNEENANELEIDKPEKINESLKETSNVEIDKNSSILNDDDDDSKVQTAVNENVRKSSINVTNAMESTSELSNIEKTAETNQENEITCAETTSFAKSWAQSVKKSSAQIDTINSSNQKSPQSFKADSIVKRKKVLKNNSESSFEYKLKYQEDSTDDEDEDEEHEIKDDDDDKELREFVDDEAMDMGRNYESGDSMDEEEKKYYAEHNLDNDEGESIGSVDTSEDEGEDDDADELNSFIAPSDEENELLEYSDDDEHNESSQAATSKKMYKRLKQISTDTEDEQALDFEVTHMIDEIDLNEQSTNNDDDDNNCAKFSSAEDNTNDDVAMEENVNKEETSNEKVAEEDFNTENVNVVEKNDTPNKQQRRSRNISVMEFVEEKPETSEKRRHSQRSSLLKEEQQNTDIEINQRRSRKTSLLEDKDNKISPQKQRRSQTNLTTAQISQRKETPTKYSGSRNTSLMEFNENISQKEKDTNDPQHEITKSRRHSRNTSSLMEFSEDIPQKEQDTNEITKNRRHSRNTSSMDGNETNLNGHINEYSQEEINENCPSLMEDKVVDSDEEESLKTKTQQVSKEQRRSRSISLLETVEKEENYSKTPKKQRHSQNTFLLETKECKLQNKDSKQKNKTPAKSRAQNVSLIVGNEHNFDEEMDPRISYNISIKENNMVEDQDEEETLEVLDMDDIPTNRRRSRKISLIKDNTVDFENEEIAETGNKSCVNQHGSHDDDDDELVYEEHAQNSKIESEKEITQHYVASDAGTRRSRNISMTEINHNQKQNTPAESRRSQNMSNYIETAEMGELTEKSRRSRKLSVNQVKDDNIDHAESTENCVIEKPRRSRNGSLMEVNSEVQITSSKADEEPCCSKKLRRSKNLSYMVDDAETNMNEDVGETATKKARRSKNVSISAAKEETNSQDNDSEDTAQKEQCNESSEDSQKLEENNHDIPPNKADKRRSNIKPEQKIMKRQRSKSFIEIGSEPKTEMEHKKPKFSVSFNYAKGGNGVDLDMDASGTTKNTAALTTKKMRLSFEETNDEKTVTIQVKNTSTPFVNKKGNVLSSDQNNISKILKRCNQMLEEAEKIKKHAKESKPAKEKKKRLKSKISNEVLEAAPSSSNKNIATKRAALHQAIQASQNILVKPTKKRRVEQLEPQNDENKYASKRLPMEVLRAVSSSSDEVSPNKIKKRKRDNFPTQKTHARKVYKSHYGDVIVESPIAVPKSKKPKIEVMTTSTGNVRIEPISPMRKKINYAGFRESPITPQATGWKMRQLLKLNSEDNNLQSEAEKKRKRRIGTAIVEPTNMLPQPTWTKSAGNFKIDKLQQQQMMSFENAGATKFEVISHKQTAAAVSSISDRALNFRETALYRENIPREDARSLLRRKKFFQ